MIREFLDAFEHQDNVVIVIRGTGASAYYGNNRDETFETVLFFYSFVDCKMHERMKERDEWIE